VLGGMGHETADLVDRVGVEQVHNFWAAHSAVRFRHSCAYIRSRRHVHPCRSRAWRQRCLRDAVGGARKLSLCLICNTSPYSDEAHRLTGVWRTTIEPAV
jgi:hypothetical protein